jgi:UDP:flavonoid glycosyltransferase YjiC (YdhE family)
MSPTRFVFETVGTRGDVAPLLALACELRRRGHGASLLAPSAFASDARAAGVDFTPITDQHLDKVGAIEFDDYYFPGFQPVVDYFERARRAGEALVVVNIDKTAASNLLCERDGWPCVRLHLTPFKLRSLLAPPWPFAGRALGPGGAEYLRCTLPRFLAACDRHPLLLAHINQRRGALGLPPAASATPEEPHLSWQGCLFPEWYAPPPPDWPSPLPFFGFPLPRPSGALAPRLAEFLARGPAPLVFTTGTGVHDVEPFFAHARAAVGLLGCRAIFLSPHLCTPSDDPALLQLDFAELELLLPRSALLVHHGGIGTLARALEAGIPQIISPLKYDQPDNAHRVLERGLGALLPRELLQGPSLAALVERLLASEPCRARVLEAQRRVLALDAIAAAATELERLTGERRVRPSVAAARAHTRAQLAAHACR